MKYTIKLGSRSLGIAGVLLATALLGCAPGRIVSFTVADPATNGTYKAVDAHGLADGVSYPVPGGSPRFIIDGLAYDSEQDIRRLMPVIVAAKAGFVPLSPERAVGSLLIVLPSRTMIETEAVAAFWDYRPVQLSLDVDKTEADTLLLAESARAARVFDRISFIRSDRPEDEAIGDNDYKIWAQRGSESFVWYIEGQHGDPRKITFARPEQFPQVALAAARGLGGKIQQGADAPMLRIGYNRVFQTPLTPDQEDILIEIHDSLPENQRRTILRHVMASKVFKKYEPIIDARAKLYCPGDYSIGFNFIGRRLIYPAIGCRVYCE